MSTLTETKLATELALNSYCHVLHETACCGLGFWQQSECMLCVYLACVSMWGGVSCRSQFLYPRLTGSATHTSFCLPGCFTIVSTLHSLTAAPSLLWTAVEFAEILIGEVWGYTLRLMGWRCVILLSRFWLLKFLLWEVLDHHWMSLSGTIIIITITHWRYEWERERERIGWMWAQVVMKWVFAILKQCWQCLHGVDSTCNK